MAWIVRAVGHLLPEKCMPSPVRFLHPGLLAGAALVALALAAGLVLPVAAWIGRFERELAALGPLAPLAFVAAYVTGSVLMVPVALLLTLLAGAAFGIPGGVAVMVPATALAASAAFVASRYLVRPRVEAALRNHPRLAGVDHMVGRHGLAVVALTRLNPAIPFGLQNYFFGLTDVRYVHYLVATVLATLPGTFLNLTLGAAGRAALEGRF